MTELKNSKCKPTIITMTNEQQRLTGRETSQRHFVVGKLFTLLLVAGDCCCWINYALVPFHKHLEHCSKVPMISGQEIYQHFCNAIIP